MDFTGLYRVDHKKKQSKLASAIREYLLPIAIILIIAFVFQFGARKLLLFPVKISTDSMTPAVQAGETRLFVYSHLSEIQKGSMILIKQGNRELLCRVVAAEGEAVQILDKSLFVNHVEVKSFAESAKDKTSFGETVTTRDNTREFLIGPRMVFCLNDNWENNQDSRSWGPIELKDVKGKALFD